MTQSTQNYAYYVIVDVDKIQEFIFEASTLKHIVGASVLIAYLTSQEFCFQNELLFPDHKVTNIKALKDNKWMEIYFGGGNMKLLFANKEAAIRFLESYQLKFYIELDSASFTSIIYKIALNTHTQFEQDLQTAERELNRLKHSKQKAPNNFANPVFEICPTCKKRCLERKKEINFNNSDSLKEDFVCNDCNKKDAARKKEALETNYKSTLLASFRNLFSKKTLPFPVKFVSEFQEFKDKSSMAIVNIDGNQFGMKLKKEINKRINNQSPEENLNQYIYELNDFSKEINKKTLEALQESVNETAKEEELLFRPIIIGGDDICFIIEGRKALSFTETLLNRLQEKFSEFQLTFAAGISIIKPTFPFFIAHRLSEALLKNVKKTSREYSGLDFEIIFSSSVEDLEQLRKKKYEYTLDKEHYVTTFRPYFIPPPKNFNQSNHNPSVPQTESHQLLPKLSFRSLEPTLGIAIGVKNRKLLASNKIRQLRALIRKGKIESLYDFRLMIGRMSIEEQNGIWKRLKSIYPGYKEIWRECDGIFYNNFIDISELNQFYPKKIKGEQNAD